MEKDLILEIGTEEIPAGVLSDAISNLGNIVEEQLQKNFLKHKEINCFGTPRRLSLLVKSLSEKQSDKTIDIPGPPAKIAFDENHNPTKAAIGFAKSQGVNVNKLIKLQREKGEIIALRKTIKGKKTEKILPELLPKIILSIPFAKSMKWGDGEISFVRPVRWILCLFGKKTITFRLQDVKSGSKTYGHRFTNPKPFNVTDWKDYRYKLRRSFIVLEQKKRKQIIISKTQKICCELGGVPYKDEDLINIISNLVEYPLVLHGEFDKKFLKLPKEVLISVMKIHQKYIPVLSKLGSNQKLMPYFIFVCGTPVKEPDIVIKGNERVIRARFNDADFFFSEDTKEPLTNKVEKLKTMVYLSQLGTYYDKIKRMEKLAEYIYSKVDTRVNVDDLKYSARLSKADLTTQMVFEFPELQGVIGKYYALNSGEKQTVSKAIEEHYMPNTRDGKLPETTIGSLLSIIDKVDNISSCFLLGFEPTGSSDPYALRRQAIGIINIILYKKLNLNIECLFSQSLKIISEQFKLKEGSPLSEILKEIMDFMTERFRNIMINKQFENDVILAVTSVEFNDINKTKNKIESISEIREAVDINSLATAFKRVVNILKGQTHFAKFNKKYITENAEIMLFQEALRANEVVEQNLKQNNFRKAIKQLTDLKPSIDRFFDEVLVMDENVKIRENRLSLLSKIRELYFKIADFSKLH